MMYTQQQYQVCRQQIQQKYLKLQILNWKEDVIDEIEGKCLNGSINIDATQIIRRSLNIEMVLDENKFIPNVNSPIWINKKIKIFIGVRNNITNKIVWFNKGIYILLKPSLKYNDKDKTLSLQALDKICWLNGQLSGNLQYITKILAKTPMFEAVQNTVQQLGGENKILIDDLKDSKGCDLLTPYDIEKSEDNSITDILTEIRDLYMWYEYYYDEDGRFHYQRIKDHKNDIVMHNFNEMNMNLEYNNEPNWENVKNDIMIWGAMLKDGKQIKYHIENNDIKSIFSIDKIGRRKFTYKNDKILDDNQAKLRAEYELFRHSSTLEVIEFSIVPNYTVDVNQKIRIDNEEIGIKGEYLIDKVSFGLDINSSMNITAHKLYYEN
ncbi:DUF5048 domain-containing protein [Clostridium haemolyticum]|uniref:Flagellin n=1 Tax=Clostridium haemolyticum NCTC 9693 TaxID=1443114 RepID=A0ABR4TB33_CLOHA|nr:hypothetical protein [Clostridium haemolyticum]KEI14129.1 putative flagellin [Clostridium haemolyticum NCTC 9693]